VRSSVTSTVLPGATLPTSGFEAGPPMMLPSTKTTSYSIVQVHVPVLRKRHVLSKLWPGVMLVLSGMLTSVTKAELSVHGASVGDEVGAGVEVGGTGVLVGVSVGETTATWLS